MTRSKECFKCKTIKPLTEFYKHSQMADGHLNKCKECAKGDANAHRKENIERIRKYDRDRAKNPERKKTSQEVTKKWRQEDKRRSSVHNKVARAIRSGKLVRNSCERCGNEKSYAHHEDYDKPLDVMWLCQPCHKQRHAEINKLLKVKL